MKTGVIILDRFGEAAGATRAGFYQELARYVDVVWVYGLRWGERDYEIKPVLDRIGKDVDIAWVLSINGYGAEGEGPAAARKFDCPLFIWYWDSPFLIEPESLPDEAQVLHASEDFAVHPALTGRSRFLPFSGVMPDPADPGAEPQKGICFMGTCWSATRMAIRLAGGVYDAETGEELAGPDLFEAIDQVSFFNRKWATSRKFDIKNGEVWNYYSVIKRLRYLSNIAHLDLHVYGRADWFINGLPLFPNLAGCLTLRTVNSTEEMRALLGEHRISLNIFHHQNQTGGPNFRTLESATHRIPVLSEFNRVCAELFPPGEAALYFSNAEELIEGAKELEANAPLRARLADNAAEILMQEHLHRHRCATLFDWAGRNAKQVEAGQGTVTILRNTPEGLSEERPCDETAGPPPEPLLTSRQRKHAVFRADADLFARQRVDQLKGKNMQLREVVKELRAKNKRLKAANEAMKSDNKVLRKGWKNPVSKTLTKLRRSLAVLK